MHHAGLATLEEGLEHIRRSPADAGTVELIVRRPAVEEREVLEEAQLDPVEGLVGDCWSTRGSSSTEDGSAHPDMQLSLMNARVAALLAPDRESWGMAGDQLYVDLDLSGGGLPSGTRLRVGSAEVEVTGVPHRGCGKFSRRFGVDAMRFVNSPAGRELNLRGIFVRILEGGTVRTGDAIRRV